ncbi:MAG TPA: hypothetical protein VN289_08770 [Paraburkholderia sp.]|jgi:hypothetical protein|uniref:hypothetical protein n=1 Tax=Paraburkholderia sp. Tr-20389 TaxID=2703903 RepID=UPI0019813961|nr:hypothetical protein [Paraburkholderia sp. Tr-20389]MBN3758937.1 hypothetical protein [Paraburkholderia sp. Tr-20389]HWT36362.1 hypothetical protein [Paraburkholderia sp.]
MNTKHIQTFLMVSAAFFAMSAPMRPNSANALANAVTRTTQVAATTVAVNQRRSSEDDTEQRG